MSKRPSVQLLVGRGYSLPCAVTLDALFDSGAKIVTHGKWILIVRESLHGEMVEHAKYASANCAQVAVATGAPADLRYLERVIRNAIADTFWREAWETRQNYLAEDDRSHQRRRLPKTSADAKRSARDFIAEMEKLSGLPIAIMYQVAADKPVVHSWEKDAATAEDFGHYTEMQAMGHGVAWDDSHPAHGFSIPSWSYYF